MKAIETMKTRNSLADAGMSCAMDNAPGMRTSEEGGGCEVPGRPALLTPAPWLHGMHAHETSFSPLQVMAVALGLAALTGGCCANKPGIVAKNWSRMIRQEQVVPIFPPREDVRVGDVYVTLTPPKEAEKHYYHDDGKFLEIPVRLCSVGNLTALVDEYTKRPPYPRTPTNGLVSSRLVVTNHTEIKGKDGSVTNTTSVTEFPLLLTVPDNSEVPDPELHKPKAPDRLRHVAFPEFSTVTLNSGALQFVVPIKAVSTAVGGAAAKAESASLRISSAESCGLPADLLYSDLQRILTGGGGSGVVGGTFSNLFTALAGSEDAKKAGDTNRIYLSLLTEVYYARTIDVSYDLKESIGGALGVKANPGASLVDAAANAAARATMLNALNAQVLAANAPGGSLAFTSVSDTAIGLRRTYSRPISIGYRGLTLEMNRDAKTGAWRMGSVSPSSSAILLAPLQN
jgi:hypothetical protein